MNLLDDADSAGNRVKTRLAFVTLMWLGSSVSISKSTPILVAGSGIIASSSSSIIIKSRCSNSASSSSAVSFFKAERLRMKRTSPSGPKMCSSVAAGDQS